MSLFRYFIGVVLCLGANVATAKTYVDASVKKFIAAKATMASQETMNVVVMYDIQEANLASGPIEKQLRQQTAAAEKSILKGMNIHALKQSLWIIGGSVLTLTASEVESLSQNPVIKSITDGDRHAEIVGSSPGGKNPPIPKVEYTYGLQKIGVPEVRADFPGITGKGVRVGIIDTGADPSHPALNGKIDAFKDFSGSKMVNPDDDHGHGTHVAGTIAGSDTDGQAIGIAPEVRLIIAKAFNSGGGSSQSSLLEAMQWVADPDGDPTTADFAQVVNNSWSAGGSFSNNTPDKEPFCVALSNWYKIGMVPVFAAGNSGPSSSSIRLPAACPLSLTVGATTESDSIASFSSRGPVKWKNGEIVKPDVAAPGEEIYSAQPGGGFTYKSGTSMACPHAVGSIALILQASKGISVDDAEKALIDGSVDLGRSGKDTVFGAGRIHVPSALRLLK